MTKYIPVRVNARADEFGQPLPMQIIWNGAVCFPIERILHICLPEDLITRYTIKVAGKHKYGNIDDPDYRKEIIDTFVNSVFVYDDKLVLTYNYKDGSETLTLRGIEAALSSNLDGLCPPQRIPDALHQVFLIFTLE